jgi:hypothetical protein
MSAMKCQQDNENISHIPVHSAEPVKRKRGRPRKHHPFVRLFARKLIGKVKPTSCCKRICVNNVNISSTTIAFYRRMVHEPHSIKERWSQIDKFIRNGPVINPKSRYHVDGQIVCQSYIVWLLNVSRKALR